MIHNEQVKRNTERFPDDFTFQLTTQETKKWKKGLFEDNPQPIPHKEDEENWSQTATSSGKHRGAAYRPYAFTEHGAIMVATVLNSLSIPQSKIANS